LPTAESLSALPKGQRVTSVGYGAYDVVKAQGAGDTITGDYVCRAANVTCRLDTASARNFLEEYVALP
jgi:hypothetical protein